MDNKLMITVHGGLIFFDTDKNGVEEAMADFKKKLDEIGVNVDNLLIVENNLRDKYGSEMGDFKMYTKEFPYNHYDCNHDCDALYEAYEKGKNDERIRIMKAIEGGK